MSENLIKLLSSASPSLLEDEPNFGGYVSRLAGILNESLLYMLRKRNGFYALESALHVFPSNSTIEVIGLDKWNQDSLWRNEYKGLADRCLFFAEDIFGGQFCIKENKIYSFDPENGELEYLAKDIEEWANVIIKDYEVLTGYSLAHEWQKQNGQIPSDKRLLPKIPFVAGGGFTLENLYLNDAVEGMRYRADIANQIKDLPDGAQIQFDIIS